MRKGLLISLLVAVISLGGYSMSMFLHSQDTSWSGYLSGLMLNIWGGEEDQLIRVNLHNHSLALYQNGVLYKLTKIAATGNPSDRTATPTGTFRILSKDKWHISTLSGVIMPLSLRFYQGYYFHDIPLTPSGRIIDTKYSHGCIRLPHDIAEEMFDWAHVGAYVEVYDASLARPADSPTVYFLDESGHRYPIANEAAFISHGFQWQNVVVVPSEELDGLPIGSVLN